MGVRARGFIVMETGFHIAQFGLLLKRTFTQTDRTASLSATYEFRSSATNGSDPMMNNGNPMATDLNDGGVWRQEGAHIMMLFPDMDVVADLPRNPFAGGPYIMWGGTPMEHVILPMEAKEPPK
jgi:hypothetical protein